MRCHMSNLGTSAHSPPTQTLQAVLDQISQGTILCDCDGRLVYANPAALSFLTAADGIRLDSGVMAAEGGDGKALRAAIVQACQMTSPRAEMLFIRGPEGPPLVVSIAPVPEAGGTRLALLLIDPATGVGEQVMERLQHLFRLSRPRQKSPFGSPTAIPWVQSPVSDRSPSKRYGRRSNPWLRSSAAGVRRRLQCSWGA